MSSFVAFWKDSIKELKKVHWPNKPSVVETSLIVGVSTVIFAAFLWLVDLGIAQLFTSLFYSQ